MKKIILISGILILSSSMIFLSCKKEDTPVTPIEGTPAISFVTGAGYISSDMTDEVNTTFKVGVLGNSNPNTNSDLATFKANRIFNGASETVFENNNIGESTFSWESNQLTNSEVGEEKWTFTLTDSNGETIEISFTITTLAQGTLAPVLAFIEGVNYVSEDISLDVGSTFLSGITASENPNTKANIHNFKISRIFNNTITTVFEESDIDSPTYYWEDSLISNAEVGDENWTFIVTDETGGSKEVSFIVTTTDLSTYIPVFSPTYLIVNQGGIELLDFYITCVSDDWEMTKIIVTYPGGLGNETYMGSGQIITQYTPFTFSNYFPKMGGTWTFTIQGIVKSGEHVNESFTAMCSVVVTG